MREQENVTFEPNVGPAAFPVCGGSGTPGSMYGAAYGVTGGGLHGGGHGHGDGSGYHGYGQGRGSGQGAGQGNDAGWIEAAQNAIGQVDVRGGRGCARAMWPDRLGGVRFGACCPTEISFGRIMPEFTRAAMQAQEEEVQKQMLADARSAQSSEVGSGEFSEYDVVLQSQERTIDPETMPHLSADYGGYRDFGTFAPPSGHGYGSGQGQGQGYGSGQGQGQGQGSGPFNGGRCSWR